jgi:hypothetical protein
MRRAPPPGRRPPEGAWCDGRAVPPCSGRRALRGNGSAWPAPPPTEPGDGALTRSRAQVDARARRWGGSRRSLAELDTRTDDLQADLAARREDAQAALDDLTAARAAAARRPAAQEAGWPPTPPARPSTTHGHGGPLRLRPTRRASTPGLRTAHRRPGPLELVARAEYSEMVGPPSSPPGRSGAGSVARTNAESAAKAARADADARQGAAAAAKQVSDDALAAADTAAQRTGAGTGRPGRPSERPCSAQLDAAETTTRTLHAQRDRSGRATAGGGGAAAREEAAAARRGRAPPAARSPRRTRPAPRVHTRTARDRCSG